MKKVTRAAVCRFGAIGDNLMAASVLPALKQRYDEVDVLTQEPTGALFENNPHVSRIVYPDMSRMPGAPNGQGGPLEWQEWFQTRGKEYDRLVHLSHSCESRLALQEMQTQFWSPASYRRKLCAGNYLEEIYDVAECSYELIGREPLFFPTDEEIEDAQKTKAKVGGKFVAWVLSGSRFDKIYPYGMPAIARLIKELNIPVIMFGAPGVAFEMARGVQDYVKKHNSGEEMLHLALSPDPVTGRQWYIDHGLDPDKGGNWPVRRSMATVLASDLIISPDTGMAWGAAFSAVPKILLLSHASPENITKYWHNTTTLHAEQKRVPCWPCHQLHNRTDTCTFNAEKNGAACISDISVEAIMKITRAWLENQEFGRGETRERLRGPMTSDDAVRENIGKPSVAELEAMLSDDDVATTTDVGWTPTWGEAED